MTLEDALHLEIAEAQSRYAYLYDLPDDHWKTPEEFEADRGGDCEDWASYCITRACRRVLTLMPTLPEPVGMILGDLQNRPDLTNPRHAWIGLGPDLMRLWFEPTPGYPNLFGAPWQYNRTPLYARRFEPGVGFIEPLHFTT